LERLEAIVAFDTVDMETAIWDFKAYQPKKFKQHKHTHKSAEISLFQPATFSPHSCHVAKLQMNIPFRFRSARLC
jgi:hypothetical protein